VLWGHYIGIEYFARMNHQSTIQLLEEKLLLTPEELLAEIGGEVKKASMRATPGDDVPDEQGGEDWVRRNRRIICERLWENEDMSSFMLGKKRYEQIQVAAATCDIIAAFVSFPLAAAAGAYLAKTGLYSFCEPHKP